jgi:hypothetical protein
MSLQYGMYTFNANIPNMSTTGWAGAPAMASTSVAVYPAEADAATSSFNVTAPASPAIGAAVNVTMILRDAYNNSIGPLVDPDDYYDQDNTADEAYLVLEDMGGAQLGIDCLLYEAECFKQQCLACHVPSDWSPSYRHWQQWRLAQFQWHTTPKIHAVVSFYLLPTLHDNSY